MKPGLYALASLDGSPLDPVDRDVLGLGPGAAVHEAQGLAVRAFDFPTAEPSIDVARVADEVLVFAGFLDEPEALSAELGVSAVSPAHLALLALDRFGDAAALKLVGEWSLLRWSASSQSLTLLISEGTRDQLYWACDGARVAVSPDPLCLGALRWVGLTLDAEGFVLNLARAGLRRVRSSETVWKGITAVVPSTREIFTAAGRSTLAPAAEPEPVAFGGKFEDAIEALNALGRRIVGQNMRRYGRSAFLLSGGLDSSLLTSFGAYERGSDGMFCLTSAALEGSGLRDEREFAAAVAEQLRVPMQLVAPAADARVYRLSQGTLEFEGQLLTSSRHYLHDALFTAARDGGAGAVFDGVMGEMSITEKPLYDAPVDPLRRVVYAARRWREEQARRNGWPADAFHVCLAAPLLQGLPAAWRSAWRAGMPKRPRLSPESLRGLHPAISKNQSAPTALPQGLRRMLPFRDRRLLRFAAGLPYGFGDYGGQPRAMAVALLKDRMPDSVRLRPRGMPFSPDYTTRMAQQAPEAKQRIKLFREAGVERWIDLDWLSGALDRLAAGANPYAPNVASAQVTALAAEFLLWCRERGVTL